MAERVRYKKMSDSLLESVRVFSHPTNGAQYKVLINKAEDQWLVVDAETEIVAASGRNTNVNKLQLAAREALVNLGVTLHTEKRRERTKKTATASV